MIRLLRRSLTARTVLVTVILSGLSVVAIGGFLSYSLANSFYQNRLEQVLAESERAVVSVQTTVAAASLVDETALQTLLNSVVPSLEISGGSATRQVALLRSPCQGQLQLLLFGILRQGRLHRHIRDLHLHHRIPQTRLDPIETLTNLTGRFCPFLPELREAL